MYWIWIIVTSPHEYLLDRSLGLVVKGRLQKEADILKSWHTKFQIIGLNKIISIAHRSSICQCQKVISGRTHSSIHMYWPIKQLICKLLKGCHRAMVQTKLRATHSATQMPQAMTISHQLYGWGVKTLNFKFDCLPPAAKCYV